MTLGEDLTNGYPVDIRNASLFRETRRCRICKRLSVSSLCIECEREKENVVEVEATGDRGFFGVR